MLPCDRTDCPGKDQRIALACKSLKPTLMEFSAVWAYNPKLDEAIEVANGLPFAFQASIFTQAIGPALRAAERLDASAVMVNDHTAFRTDCMPFAGRRQSGYGVGGIPWSMREMTQEKMIVLRRTL